MSESKNNLDELREHLFATLRWVKDGSMDIDRARAVVQVAGVLIDSARVEVDYARVTGETGGSTFISRPPRLVQTKPDAPDPSIVSRRVHRLEG